MGFLNTLFGKKKRARTNSGDWDKLLYLTDGVNFNDQEQRSRFVMGCLEQIAVADRETEKLKGEYTLVTDYLADSEEIEALPESEKKLLEQNARTIRTLEREIESYLERERKMSDQDYQTMRSQEQNVAEGIKKLQEAERYSGLIRQDLKKLDVERQAHAFREQELEGMCTNYRGMAVIFLVAMVICLVLLSVLQFGFQMNANVGYFIAVMSGAIAVTLVCVKYMDSQRELEGIRRAISKLIQLQNKVKIRYVNNTNLLEYLRLKYNTDSAEKLAGLWESYQQEKEIRRQFAEDQSKIEYYQDRLEEQLRRYRLKYPGRWVSQTAAILDPKEMVEIRHELILRRQALRKQLDYNKKAAEEAHQQVLEIILQYPDHSAEILDMVEKYRQESEILS